MRKVLIRIGDFDPIHYGHLFGAANILRIGLADEIWFVPSGKENWSVPHGKVFYRDHEATPEDRFTMCKLAVDHFFTPKLPVSVKNPDPYGNFLYTSEIIEILERNFPGREFYVLIGSDHYPEFLSWKSVPRMILEERPGYPMPPKSEVPSNFRTLSLSDQSYICTNISSTMIRRLLGEGKSIEGLTPVPVVNYILENGIYRPRICSE